MIKPIPGLGGVSVLFPNIPTMFWCVTVISSTSTGSDTSGIISTSSDTSSRSFQSRILSYHLHHIQGLRVV